MTQIRYEQARTLVRRILPRGESKADFRQRREILRKHFQQFNADASDLCQWLMAVSPYGKKPIEGTETFWRYFLEPVNSAKTNDRKDGDRKRRELMDYVLGMTDKHDAPDEVANSLDIAKQQPPTKTATKLFDRLRSLTPEHRLVLCKSAAEWVVSRYFRQRENYESNLAVWTQEKADWEAKHPDLTPSVQKAFNDIYKKLGQTDEGIRRRNPRICTHARMKGGLDNCEFNGERVGGIRHGPWCVKFLKELGPMKNAKLSQNKKLKVFVQRAEWYLAARVKFLDNKKTARRKPEAHHRMALEHLGNNIRDDNKRRAEEATKKKASKKPKKSLAPETVKRQIDANLAEFQEDWERYLELLGVKESTLIERYRKYQALPHCTSKAGTNNQCEFNPHTDNCKKYMSEASRLPSDILAQEDDYREWRKSYWLEPRKPQFKYPSSKSLPMPKVFGHGHFRANFDDSTIELKMESGEWLKFAFDPWPKKYHPQPSQNPDIITSVQVTFHGNRVRLGFRFDTEHKRSRIGATQEQIDELRSRTFPRASNDGAYLDAVRDLVCNTFDGDAEREMRLFPVDLGGNEGGWATMQGRDFTDHPFGGLPIVKIQHIYDAWPKIQNEKGKEVSDHSRGLNVNHLVRHRDRASELAEKVIEARRKLRNIHGEQDKIESGEMLDHDFRGLFAHMQNMMKDWVRLNVSAIINKALEHNADLIVVDGSRKAIMPGYDKDDLPEKQRKAYRAFGKIRHKLREKCVEHGMRLVTVPEEGTSSACAACGKKQENKGLMSKHKAQRLFVCEHCGYRANSDQNAAIVLGRVFWGELTPWKDET